MISIENIWIWMLDIALVNQVQLVAQLVLDKSDAAGYFFDVRLIQPHLHILQIDHGVEAPDAAVALALVVSFELFGGVHF